MTFRTKRRLVALAFVAPAFLYSGSATRPAQEAIAAQQPSVAAPSAAVRHVDRDLLLRETSLLSSPEFGGRRTGSPGGLRARAWIAGQFAAAGLAPAGTAGYLQPFSFTLESGLVRPARPLRTEYKDAANVIGRIEGSRAGARPIVLSAHYDHLGSDGQKVYFGADDNASGIAVLLAVARHLTRATPRHPVIVAAFDAEELGLRGARAFAAAGPTVRTAALNINLDMVSRSDRNEIFAVGTYHTPSLRPVLEDVQRRSSVRILFGHDQPGRGRGMDDWTHLSDHRVFHEAGVPFIYFGVDYHADYHEPTDTADKIDPRFFGDTADMIVEAVRAFDARLP